MRSERKSGTAAGDRTVGGVEQHDMSVAEFQPAVPKPKRWFCPTPGWLVLASLVATGLLFASERWSCFSFNEHKGWTVLIAVAGVGGALASHLSWFVAARSSAAVSILIRSLLVLRCRGGSVQLAGR